MAEVILKNVRKVYPNTESKKKKAKDENSEKKHNLEITEEGVVAVQDFNIDVADKEFIVLVGPSGCGKSTTLRMIAGLEEISGGELTIDGKLMNDVAPKDRDIAMVFQNYALYPHMTVYENIAFPLKLKKVAETDADGKTHLKKMPNEEIDRRVREAAEVLDITQFLDRKPKALSGGQRQRVAIARALASDPEVLLCDEATSALDPMTTQAILRLLQKINREMGITIVVITHEMAVIRQICTHVAILDGGVIAEEGSVDDVFTHTRSEAGKRLFGIVASENHEQVQEKPAIRIVFNGETIAEPIVADLILHLGVPLSIRSADVHTLNGAQYGQLLISRPDDPMVCHRAIEYLKERGLTVEEVRA